MKYINILSIILLVIMGACSEPPELSEIPEISFRSIEGAIKRDPLGNRIDSIGITILYKDGDADLGLYNTDTLPPYQVFATDNNGNITPNYYHHNAHFAVKRMKDGVLEDILASYYADDDEPLVIRYRFPPPSPLLGSTPKIGELHFHFYLLAGVNGVSGINDFDTLIFETTIIDRALNISNTIQSDPIVVGDY